MGKKLLTVKELQKIACKDTKKQSKYKADIASHALTFSKRSM